MSDFRCVTLVGEAFDKGRLSNTCHPHHSYDDIRWPVTKLESLWKWTITCYERNVREWPYLFVTAISFPTLIFSVAVLVLPQRCFPIKLTRKFFDLVFGGGLIMFFLTRLHHFGPIGKTEVRDMLSIEQCKVWTNGPYFDCLDLTISFT